MHREPRRAGSALLRPVALAVLATLALVASAGAARADAYDLSVTIEPANSLSFDAEDFGWFQELDWAVTVTNSGPEDSPPTTLTVTPPGLGSDEQCGQPTLARSSVVCQVPALAGGEAYNTLVVGEVHRADLPSGSRPQATASSPCRSPQEGDCSNNTATGTAVVAYAPQVHITTRSGSRRARTRLSITGTAARAEPSPSSAVARVQVAIRRRSGGTCRWLNRRGGFTRTAASGGGCDRALWLPAAGTARWRFVLARGLPAGTYSAYARATSVSGASDLSFSPRRGNAITLQVR